MASPKVIPPFALEEALPFLVLAAGERGVLKKPALKALQVPAAFQDQVLGRLEAEGFEAVPGGVRVPLAHQLQRLVQARGVVGWPLGPLLKGATPAQAKAALLDLARKGAVRLLVRGKAEAVAGPDAAVLDREELRALGQLAQAVQKALKAKPLPRTLLREDVRELLLDLVKPAPSVTPRPDPAALVDRLLQEVVRLRLPDSGLCSVPRLVLACLGDFTLTRIHEALFQAVRERRLELRPESGMNRLGELELALCPAGIQDTRLSWARALEERP